MVDVLVILDGASEPLRRSPTSLEAASTPALDALARGGLLERVRTVPRGLPAGSEVAIPVLLGWTPRAPVDRGAVEAAARRIRVPAGERAWRVDVLEGGRRAGASATAAAARALRAPGRAVHPLAGHRLLVVGRRPLPVPGRLHVWPPGAGLPRTLDPATVMVAARGAAAGIARAMGAEVVVPAGATGDPATDLRAKAAAAAAADRAKRVVVHVAGADEAAHTRDGAAKVAFLERADRELIAPLRDALERSGGTLSVCSDHGCDPRTGAHDAAPVPFLTWGAGGAPSSRGRRFTERAVAELPARDLTAAAAA